MAFPADWSRRVSVTGASPSATLSGYVALITGDNLPSEIWTTALNGGGDLRIALNSDGTSPLPLEVVSFDTSAETAVLWVRFPTYSSASRECWIFYGKAAETQPAVTDTLGRNAVWADYEVVTHDGVTDSTGNTTLTPTNITSSEGLFSNAVKFNGTNSRIDTTISPAFQGGTLQSWIKLNAARNNDEAYISIANSGVVNQQLRSQVSSTRNQANSFDGSASFADTFSALSSDTSIFQMVHCTYEPSQKRAYHTGANLGTNSTPYSISGIDRLTLGVTADSTPFGFFSGELCEAWYTEEIKTGEQVSTEYDNQSSPSTFWTTGTPENTTGGGGGTITVTGTTTNYTYNAISATIDLTGTIEVTGATGNYAYSPISATVDLTSEIVVTGATSNYNYQAIDASIDLTPEITVTGGTANYSYTAQNGVVELGAVINVIGATSNYSYAAIDAIIELAGEIVVNANTATYSYNGIRGVVQIGEETFNVNFNGYIKKSEFSGIIKQSAFFGNKKTMSLSGTRKQSQFSGVIK